MNTRRHPRTLEEAFGPYTSKEFAEPEDPMPAADVIVVAACAIAALVLTVMALMGWLS